MDPAEDFAARAEAYRRELRVHCYRLTGSFDEAEDLVQETLLHAWRGRDRLQDEAGLRAWLYRIATNACLDFLRRVAATAAFLASDDAAAITATWINATAGMFPS